jgi:cytochrome oxidase Cu insertion factor (SCO1/SenC/PrrC family)
MMLLLARPVLAAAVLAVAVGLWAVNPASAADEGTPKVKVGQAAPDITLPATQAEKATPDAKAGEPLELKDLKGKKNVVLYFFPKALTRG